MSESGLKLVCWIAAAAFVVALLAIPQAVDPWEMPSLMLDRASVTDAIAFDRALADETLDSEEAQTLRSLFLDHGRAEANPPYSRRDYDRRQAEIHHATQALLAAKGPPGFEAMRATAVERLADAFFDGHHEPENDDEAAMMGAFVELTERYGMVHDGVVVAPKLAIRALYKARWNGLHRRPLTEGFFEVENQAYWGWLALHGWGAPMSDREDALVAFRDAGGAAAQEAAALFDLLDGRPDRAATSLQQLYAATGELRLRNMGLAALQAALFRAGAP